jgi:hypothetical protein
VTTDGDWELRDIVSRHYSSKANSDMSKGNIGPGYKILLRTANGDAVFGWLWAQAQYRADGFDGYNRTVFRNESPNLSSEMILEAEEMAIQKWGLAPKDGFFN